MADIKLTEKPSASLANTASLVVTQPVAGVEAIRRVPAVEALGYVTPEMYGAVGDGVHDDGPALKAALETETPVRLTRDLHLFSQLFVVNHDVCLDGNGYTIYVDLDGTEVGWENPFAIMISTDALAEGTSDLKVVTGSYRESIEAYREVGTSGDSYVYGYVSYKGCVHMPQFVLDKLDADEEKTTTYYPVHTANIKNTNFVFRNCEGKYGFVLRHMVESSLENVKAICDTGHDGLTGIAIWCCSDVYCSNITCQNWTGHTTWGTMGTSGYGFAPSGDNIRVYNYHGINNRDHIAGGGVNGEAWGSRILIDGCVLESDCAAEPLASALQVRGFFLDGFEAHGNCYDITFKDIKFTRRNDDNVQFNGYLFEVRTQYATVENVSIIGTGVMSFPQEFTETAYLNNVVAPGGILRGYHGEGWQKVALGKQIILNNCVFREVQSFICATSIVMHNCIISDRIQEVSHLVMDDCVVYGNVDWQIMPTIIIEEDAQIINCDIWANASTFTKPKTPVIKAPAGTVQMVNTKIRMMPGNNIFVTEQANAVNNVIQHRYGLILRSDYSRLDEYYPFEGEAV